MATCAVAAGVAAAQQPDAGPWLPLGSPLDRMAAWLVQDGALQQLDPLSRPWPLALVRRSVVAQDTLALGPAARHVLAALRRQLPSAADSVALVAELGAAGYNNGRRDSFRPGGASGAGMLGGVWAAVRRGPFVVVLNPAFENRLRDDPEYTGYTKRFIAGRLQTGYLAIEGAPGYVMLGRMARNWGPDLFDGLQLSPSAYATDELAGALRFGRLELTTIAQRLDDDTSLHPVPATRWFLAHRLTIRAGHATWITLTETGVYGGPGGGPDPAFLAPLNPGLLTEFNDRREVNLLWGAAVHAPLVPGLSFEGEAVVDDIQIDRTDSLTNRRPWSGGVTGVLRYAMPAAPVHLALGYTRVRSLTYRNSFASWQRYAFADVGIGRNFADYDQWLLRIETLQARAHVAIDVGYTRQGAGDFRQPFPSDSVLAQAGQGFLVSPVYRALSARMTSSAELWNGVVVDGEIGSQGGLGSPRRLIAAAGVRLRFDVLSGTWGSIWSGVEPGALRDWP